MGISRQVIAVVGAGLLLATGGCSRGEAEKAEAKAPTVEAGGARASVACRS